MMKKHTVCKTVVAYGDGEPRFVLLFGDGGFATYADIAGLAAQLRIMNGPEYGLHLIKNEARGDIIWKHDDTLKDTTWECERLSREEVRQLARLLRE